MIEEPLLTRISISIGNKKFIWEDKCIDCDLDEIFSAIVGMLVGHTWLPETIYKAMRDYGQEYCELLDTKDE